MTNSGNFLCTGGCYRGLIGLMVCVAALVAPASYAQNVTVLMQGPAGVVTATDVAVNSEGRIPKQAWGTVMSRPENVGNIASDVYLQRAMAREAEKMGLTQGATASTLLAHAQEKALADLYRAEIDKRNTPSEQALENYARSLYRVMTEDKLAAPERVRVRHILLKAKSPEAREKADSLLAKLKAGADFASLAEQLSDDPGSASKGGDLGFVSEGTLLPDFEAAVKKLQAPGELSPIVETTYGLHVIRFEERRPAGPRGFDELRDQLITQARATILREARSKDSQRLLVDAKPNDAAIDKYARDRAEALER